MNIISKSRLLGGLLMAYAALESMAAEAPHPPAVKERDFKPNPNQTMKKQLLITALTAILAWMCFTAGAETTYTITDLGTLGGSNIYPTQINDSGQVVGYGLNSNNVYRAFLWSAGSMLDLGTLGGTNASAFGINNGGQIVGAASTASGKTHAFIYSNGVMTDLNIPGSPYSAARGINQGGDICGEYVRPEDAYPGPSYYAFLYASGNLVHLGTLPGDGISSAFSINASGEIVGMSRPAGGGYPHQAVIWNPSQPNSTNYTVQPLAPHFGGKYDHNSFAMGINDAGQVTGLGSYRSSDRDYQPFLYSNGKIAEFTLPNGFPTGGGLGINNCSKIVGGLFDSFYNRGLEHAYVYDPAVGVRDLNDLVPTNSNWVLTEANSVNLHGQIAGYGITNGENHAFILTPVAPTVLELSPPVLANGQVIVPFAAPVGLPSLTLLQATQPDGPWTTNRTVVTNNACGCFTTPVNGSASFYRLRSP